MKGIVIFLGLLLIASTATAVTLDAGALSACAAPTGCPLAALASTYGLVVSAFTDKTDLVITATQPATVTIPADLHVSTVSIQGLVIVSVEKNARFFIENGMAVAQFSQLTVFGYLQTASGAAGGNSNVLINGILLIAGSASAFFQNGVNVGTTGAFNLAAGANAQVTGATSVLDGVVSIASTAVLAYVDTTVRVVGAVSGVATGYFTTLRANVLLTATGSFTSTLSLTGDTIVQAQGVAAIAGAVVVENANNVMAAATGVALSVKGTILVTATGALTTVGKVIMDNKVTVTKNLTVTQGNSPVDAPQFNGGIYVDVGGRFNVAVDTAAYAACQSDIKGALVLFAGASYNAQVAAHTIVSLFVEAAGTIVAAATGSSVLIYQYVVAVSGSVGFIGNVVATAKP